MCIPLFSDVSAMIEGAVPTIRAATLEKLIEKLTNERYCGAFTHQCPTIQHRRTHLVSCVVCRVCRLQTQTRRWWTRSC
jgi:siderophore synthetase component